MNEPDFTPSRVAALVLAAAAALVALAAIASAQVAIIALGVFGVAGAAARVVAPLSRSFVVRRRYVDVAVLGTLGLGLIYLGLTTPLG